MISLQTHTLHSTQYTVTRSRYAVASNPRVAYIRFTQHTNFGANFAMEKHFGGWMCIRYTQRHSHPPHSAQQIHTLTEIIVVIASKFCQTTAVKTHTDDTRHKKRGFHRMNIQCLMLSMRLHSSSTERKTIELIRPSSIVHRPCRYKLSLGR